MKKSAVFLITTLSFSVAIAAEPCRVTATADIDMSGYGMGMVRKGEAIRHIQVLAVSDDGEEDAVCGGSELCYPISKVRVTGCIVGNAQTGGMIEEGVTYYELVPTKGIKAKAGVSPHQFGKVRP